MILRVFVGISYSQKTKINKMLIICTKENFKPFLSMNTVWNKIRWYSKSVGEEKKKIIRLLCKNTDMNCNKSRHNPELFYKFVDCKMRVKHGGIMNYISMK